MLIIKIWIWENWYYLSKDSKNSWLLEFGTFYFVNIEEKIDKDRISKVSLHVYLEPKITTYIFRHLSKNYKN